MKPKRYVLVDAQEYKDAVTCTLNAMNAFGYAGVIGTCVLRMNGKPADELIEAAKRHAPHDAELEQALRDIGALEGNKPKPTGTLPEKIKQAKETTAKHTLQFGEGERCEVCGTQLPGGQMDGVCQACRTVDKYGPEFGGD